MTYHTSTIFEKKKSYFQSSKTKNLLKMENHSKNDKKMYLKSKKSELGLKDATPNY